MSIKSITTTSLAFVVATALAAPSTASADGIDDIKGHLADGKKLWEDAKGLQKDFDALSSTVKAKLESKRSRLMNAAKSFEIVFDALVNGRPLPWYVSKVGGRTVACGDKIYLHSVAQDKVLRSEAGESNETLGYTKVNLGLNDKESLAAANITVQCRDKSTGTLMYGDVFTLMVDPDKDRPDGKNLDDGKPYFYAGTKAGYDPIVRLGSMADVKKWSAYWKFRGGDGEVQTGIPLELIATNRPDNASIAGFCGSGPAGAFPILKVSTNNHCTRAKLVAALVAEGVGKPPRWIEALLVEVKALATELRTDISNAGGGSSGGPTTPSPKSSRLPFGR